MKNNKTEHKDKNGLFVLYQNELKYTAPRENVPRHVDETFHQLMKLFLVIGQCFAALPLSGITSKSANSLVFHMKSFRILYTLVISLASAFMGLLTFYWSTSLTLKFENMVPFIWFSSNTVIMWSFVKLAKKWPKLMTHWEQFEANTAIRDRQVHLQMKRLITSSSVGIPLLSLLEHLLSLANNVNTATMCKFTKDPMEAYFKQAFPAFYAFFNVNYFNGIFLQILNLFCTFMWNYLDNFIVLISFGLITQFRHFNSYLHSCKGKPFPDDFWGKQRTYYNKLTNLLHHVNKDLSRIILISYSNNLFYICLQLYHSVTPSNSWIRSVYFWYSLGFLLGRTVLVSATAANINDESKKPIKVLQLIPPSCYQSEAKRFMHQLTFDTVALSGMQFFYITRTFMLSVTGTVITYELVLIQLQRQPTTEYDPCEG
ncbi:Gr64e.2 family protein [Megaselia abdita]